MCGLIDLKPAIDCVLNCPREDADVQNTLFFAVVEILYLHSHCMSTTIRSPHKYVYYFSFTFHRLDSQMFVSFMEGVVAYPIKAHRAMNRQNYTMADMFRARDLFEDFEVRPILLCICVVQYVVWC